MKEVVAVATVFDVAKYILERQSPMSTWKLQKLCFYCQAWHYAWTERPLFPEHFEAWVNGPVCPALFGMHRGKFTVSVEDIDGHADCLTDDERDSVNIVLRDYGDMEPYELRSLTHREDPWKLARGDIPDDAKCTNEITLESMGLYYGGL